MTIAKIRKLLGHKFNHLSDEEVLKIEADMRTLANILIDKIESMSPEERAELDKKIRAKKRRKKKLLR